MSTWEPSQTRAAAFAYFWSRRALTHTFDEFFVTVYVK